jgi:transposase
VHKRFSRWASIGVWEKVFHELVRDRRNQYLMIDSAIVRAHQQVATGRKKAARTKALARSRRRWTLSSPRGRRTAAARHRLALGERKVSHVLADKGYDTDAIAEHVAIIAKVQPQSAT